jgi:hypothetical protein
MRRIESPHVHEKKQQRRTKIFVLAMLGLLVLSTVGYSFSNLSGTQQQETKVIDNAVEFISVNNVWTTSLQGVAFAFQYLPSEVATISGRAPVLSTYGNQVVYYVTDSPIIESEIVRNMNGFTQRMQRVCHDANAPCGNDANLPLKNCANDYIVVLKKSEQASVTQDRKCVIISGSDELSQLQAVDAFFYKSLGVLS